MTACQRCVERVRRLSVRQLTPVDPKSKEYKVIEAYVAATAGGGMFGSGAPKILDVWEVRAHVCAALSLRSRVRIARVAPAERRRSRQFRLAPSASCVASDSPSPQHIAQQHPLPLRTRVQAFQSASALALLPLRSATCRLQSRIRPSHHTRARNDVSPVADPRAAAPHTRQGPSRRAKMATALFRPAIRGFGKHTRGAARPRLVSPSRRVHLHPSPASTPIMHA